MLKMHFDRPITVKVDEILEKDEQGQHINNYDYIGKEHQPQNSFKPFREGWIQKNSMLGCYMI